MLGQRVRGTLPLLHPSPVGTASDRAASSRLSRLQQKKQEWWEEAVNSIDLSHSSRKAWRTVNKLNWQVWTLLSPVPRLGKLHRLATREERGTQDRGPQVHQACQQGAVRPMEDSNTWASQYLWTLQVGGACCCPQMPEARKVCGIGFHLPGISTPRRGRFSNLGSATSSHLHVPTKNFKDLEKNTNSCNPCNEDHRLKLCVLCTHYADLFFADCFRVTCKWLLFSVWVIFVSTAILLTCLLPFRSLP